MLCYYGIPSENQAYTARYKIIYKKVTTVATINKAVNQTKKVTDQTKNL